MRVRQVKYHCLSRALKWFPRRRRGKYPSLQTMYRWSTRAMPGSFCKHGRLVPNSVHRRRSL